MMSFKIRSFVIYGLMVMLGAACLIMILRLGIAEGAMSNGTGSKVLDTTDSSYVPSPGDSVFKCFVINNDLSPIRGEIYDDQGRLLVGNITVFEVAFDGLRFANEYKDTLSKDPNAFDALFTSLSKSLFAQFKDRYPKYTENYYKEFFTQAVKNKKYKTLFPVKEGNEKSWVSGSDTAYIKHLECWKKDDDHKYHSHLNYVSTPVRINPYGDIARRTLGMNVEGKRYGMEFFMNQFLSGQQGSKKFLRLNKTVVPLKDRIEPIDGYNLHTTINAEIQNYVHNELALKLSELGAHWGCAIVMETKTGEIKAISNLKRDADGHYDESMEYAFNAKVEPGSTFKLASLLSFLEKRSDDTTCTFPMFVHTFKYPLKSGNFRNYHKQDSKVHGETLGTVSEIIQRSSNIGVASMIFDTYGMKGFSDYRKQLIKLGIMDTIHTQLGDVMPASIRNDGRFDNYYGVCFGAGFNIPILHTLVYYNAIANDGKMVAPLFVKYVTNNYDTIQRFEAEVLNEQLVSPVNVEKAKGYLKNVVWGPYGTGRRYKDSTCMFAGKTGTRDIWDPVRKGYDYDHNAVSFCGYFPLDTPKYTMIVYIYFVPQHSEVAVDAFARIARAMMNRANFSAMRKSEEMPFNPNIGSYPVNSRYFNTLFRNIGYDTTALAAGNRFLTPLIDTVATIGNKPWLPSPQGSVPDVRNMIASDAIGELARAGYKARITGRGLVKTQTLDPATHTVMLELEPR
jgi:cell division protein FtsI (penicillin-binding protein 3)